MAMGWDDAIMLMMAAASAGSAMNPPENNTQTPGQAAGPNPMQQQPLAPPQSQVQPGQVQPLNTDPLTGLASELAKTGQPPPQQAPQSQPVTKGPAQEMGPPAPSEDPVAQAGKNEASWASLLAASPQAIAAIAPLLGLGPTSNSQHAAPVAGSGGSANQMMVAPPRRSLADVLGSLRI